MTRQSVIRRFVNSLIERSNPLSAKLFAIILDHHKKRVIHGEVGPAYKIEHVTGLSFTGYESREGWDSDLRKLESSLTGYTYHDTYTLWEEEVKPAYFAKIAELRRQGFDVHPAYYD
jgi:hypothetical protein